MSCGCRIHDGFGGTLDDGTVTIITVVGLVFVELGPMSL